MPEATAREFPRSPDRPELYRFKLQQTVGEGGTGRVYRALDPKTGQVVAVKLFHANFFRNKLHIRDLARTTKKFRKLSHPNVVQIYEFISGDEGECLALEFVDGPDLRWYLKNRPWNLNEMLVIVAQICNGLGYLHEKGIMHHDLKLANVLFTRKGVVKICDFSLWGSNILLSLIDGGPSEQVTPMYVAPELIRKEKATPLSDLYSLGILFYVMFTGKVPFEVDSLAKLYHCHLTVRPFHPSDVNEKCPKILGDIIMRLLEKEPARRFPDCDELRIALSQIGKSRI